MTTPRWLQNLIATSRGKVSRLKRELRFTVTYRDAKRLERELKQAQIECAYAQHWVTLT
jgi:hypothetical protein